MGVNSVSTETNSDLDEQISQLMQCKPLSEQQVCFFSFFHFLYWMIFFGRFDAGTWLGKELGFFLEAFLVVMVWIQSFFCSRLIFFLWFFLCNLEMDRFESSESLVDWFVLKLVSDLLDLGNGYFFLILNRRSEMKSSLEMIFVRRIEFYYFSSFWCFSILT